MKKVVFVLVLAFVLASCANEDPAPLPSPSPSVDGPQTGECLSPDDVTGTIVLNESNIVDCETPHTAEIIAVVDIPWHFFQTGAPNNDEYANLRASLDGALDNAFQLRFKTWSDAVCEGAFQEATGMNEIELADSSAIRSRIVPMSNTSEAIGVFKGSEEWVANPQLFCLNQFVRDSSKAQIVLRPVTGLATQDFLTQREPITSRVCLDRNGESVTCFERHHEELLFSFSAAIVPDEDTLEFVRAARAAADGDALASQLERYAEICRPALDIMIGEDWDSKSLRAGARFGSGWDTPGAIPRVICTVEPIDPKNFDLPGGSVIGAGNAPIQLLPRAVSEN